MSAMNTNAALDSLVGTLYDVSLGECDWQLPLQTLAETLGAENSHLLAYPTEGGQASVSIAWGIPQSMQVTYAAHYGAIDPRRLKVAELAEGQWWACHQHITAHSVTRCEFYQDYLIPNDLRFLLGVRLTQHAGQNVFLGLHRRPDQTPFGADEIEQLTGLTSHLQRAVKLWLSTEALREQAVIGRQGLEALEYGVLALDSRHQLLFTNRMGEALLRKQELLTLKQRRLCATATRDDERLTLALRVCQSTRQAQSLRLGQTQGTRHCIVSILALPESSHLTQQLYGASLLVLINHSEHRRTLGVKPLMHTFGLSAAEARLANALARGASLQSYADEVELSQATVKTQLQAVLRKTGTQRQVDLVRQIVQLPALRQSERHKEADPL